jgi:PAS domain S-box-containing protein
MGDRVRAFDWAGTRLGPPAQWPAALRAAVGICLNSRFPMFVWWGPDLVNLYNNAYAPMLGKRHPAALGRPARDVWADIWPAIGPQADAVMRRGQATWNERVPLLTERNGFPEEAFFTWSYSPIYDDAGAVAGLFCAVTEDTARVAAERDLRRAQDALREGEERLRLGLRAGAVGTWDWDIPAGRVTWSERIYDFHGLAPGSFDGTVDAFARLVHPDDRGRVTAAIQAAVDRDAAYDVAYRAVHPDGQVRWVATTGRVVRDAAGRPVRMLGAASDITAQKQAEAALQESEGRFRQLADAMPQIVWTAGPDGVLDYYNRRWFEFIALPPGAGDAARWDRFVHPDDLPRAAAAWARAVAAGEPYSTEFRVRRADGAYRWFLVRAQQVRESDGGVARWYGTCTDIEDRRRAEARDRFLLALDAAVRPLSDPAEITAAHARLLGEFLAVDRCAYADVEADQDTFNLTGDYTRGVHSIVGRYTFTAFGREVLRLMRADRPYVVHDIDTHEPPPEDVAAYRLTAIQAVICVPLHKDGRFVAAMAVHQKTPRTWAADEVELVRHVAARCWESIERARAERILRANQDRLRLATQTAELGIWVWDVATDAVTWENDWPYKLFGLPPAAGPVNAAAFLRDYVLPEDAVRFRQAVDGALHTRGDFHFVGRFRRADGQVRWAEFLGRPEAGGGAGAHRLLGTAADITDRKLAADERERLLAAERAARADAEAANRAKDKFLAVLSHELRTPLSPVVMTIPAIELDPDLPFKFRDDLAMVRRNIDLEVKLIDDLLDLSRITSGKLRLHLQSVRGHDVLRHALQNSLADAAGKRLHVHEAFAADDDRLTADPARLQQVFWNLLRNAVKFTPEGGHVTVRTAADDGRFVVTVHDTGVGIPPDVLPRVFDAFEQGDARMTRQFGGLGLGLAIARAVVEMHGGTITAASPGKGLGATFTVALALAAAHLPARPHPAADAPAAPPADRRARVLLVEDHPDTSRTMARLLAGYGFDVRTADSVAAALALAAAHPFDVVVSDIGLPDASGYDLIRHLQARHGLRGIALSGYGMEDDVRKSRDAGFAEHLVKPIDITQLQAALRRVLDAPLS